MRWRILRLRPLWSTLATALLLVIVAGLVGAEFLPQSRGFLLMVVGCYAVLVVLLLLPPSSRAADRVPARLAPPVRGVWTAVNSPGQKLPSHGTKSRGQFGAVDIVRPASGEGSSDPPLVRWAWRGSRPEEFGCFGEPVHAMSSGFVAEVADGQRDQRARNTWPGLIWMMTVEGSLREIFIGYRAVFGNRVVVRHDDGTAAAYAHLKQGSATVIEGERVEMGQVIGRVGNTGNTSQPHLHAQLMDGAVIDQAAGIPMIWEDIDLLGVDPAWEKYTKEREPTALKGMPRNGQSFEAGIGRMPASRTGR